jgi:hypothetical protein
MLRLTPQSHVDLATSLGIVTIAEIGDRMDGPAPAR